MAPPIYKLLSVLDVLYLIVEQLHDPQDILNVCLTSKTFMDVAYSRLFRTINLPEITVKPRHKDKEFYERFADYLGKYTRSLRIDGYAVANETISSIKLSHQQWELMDDTHVDLKTKLDRLFDGIEETLACTQRLRFFSSNNIPRSLDLLILLQKHHPNVESVEISTLKDDRQGLYIHDTARFPDISPGRLRPEGEGCTFPLWNGVNMKVPPNPSPVLDFPQLTGLSLSGIKFPVHQYYYVGNLASLLKGTPNLKSLELRGFSRDHPAIGRPPWDVFAGTPDVIPPGGWPNINFHQSGSLFASLCQCYRRSRAKPLKLQYLRLDTGAELGDYKDNAPPRPPYLAYLTDLSHLEELHLDFEDDSFTINPTSHEPFNPITGQSYLISHFLFPNPIRLLTDGHLPRLRKLSIPCTQGLALYVISKFDLAYAARLTVRIHWVYHHRRRSIPLTEEESGFNRYQHILGNFSGLHIELNSPCNGPGPEVVPVFPHRLEQTRSLKTRLPIDLNESARPAGGMGPVLSIPMVIGKTIDRFPAEAPKLREIWVINLAWDFERAGGERAFLSEHPEEKCRYLAEKLAERYDKLSYVRVDDMAWWIHRGASGSDGAKPELVPIWKRDVDREIPWSFDRSLPFISS